MTANDWTATTPENLPWGETVEVNEIGVCKLVKAGYGVFWIRVRDDHANNITGTSWRRLEAASDDE